MSSSDAGTRPEAHSLLDFWFGEDPWDLGRVKEHSASWFTPSDALDRTMRDRFSPWLSHASAGALDHWLESPRHSVALVLLLDQVPRNCFRRSPRAFEYDARALETMESAVARGHAQVVAPPEALFLLMPAQHSEDLRVHDRGLDLLHEVRHRAGEFSEMVDGTIQFAGRHRELIERFGRYPHRNVTLGRESTPEERRFLEEGGETFGQ